MFGHKGKLEENDIADIKHIFIAQKYCARWFITYDKKHILSKKQQLLSEFNINVVMPSEALEIINKEIDKNKAIQERKKQSH